MLLKAPSQVLDGSNFELEHAGETSPILENQVSAALQTTENKIKKTSQVFGGIPTQCYWRNKNYMKILNRNSSR